MEELLTYLKTKTEATKWPYVKLCDICYALGRYPKSELNELFIKGLITKHPGINSIIIQYGTLQN